MSTNRRRTTTDPRTSTNALARTCRALLDPALDVLWRNQHTLINVFNCMPAGLWEACSDVAVRFTLRRPITPQDWERALFYTQRIRHLTLAQLQDPTDSEGVIKRGGAAPTLLSGPILESMSASCPQPRMFPNLQSIQWEPVYPSLVPCIRIFLGLKLQQLRASLGSNSTEIALLPSLSEDAPALTSVVIKWDFHTDPDDFPLISRFVWGLKGIEELELDAIDVASILQLSQIKTLRSLALETIKLEPGIEPKTLLPLTAFPVLRSLVLHGMPTGSISTYILMFSGCRELRSWRTTIRAPFTARQCAGTFTALSENCSGLSLESLKYYCTEDARLYSDTAPGREPTEGLVSGDTLRHLYPFSHLVHVQVQVRHGFELQDTDAWQMARAWPRIQTLSLSAFFESARHKTTHMTLDGLRAFARHCPELKELAITFNAEDVPTFDGTEVEKQAVLESLDVGVSRIGPSVAPADLAAFLLRIFPALKIFYPYRQLQEAPEDATIYEAEWTRVDWAIQRTQKIVEQSFGWDPWAGSDAAEESSASLPLEWWDGRTPDWGGSLTPEWSVSSTPE